jgi:hypothetical protein
MALMVILPQLEHFDDCHAVRVGGFDIGYTGYRVLASARSGSRHHCAHTS